MCYFIGLHPAQAFVTHKYNRSVCLSSSSYRLFILAVSSNHFSYNEFMRLYFPKYRATKGEKKSEMLKIILQLNVGRKTHLNGNQTHKNDNDKRAQPVKMLQKRNRMPSIQLHSNMQQKLIRCHFLDEINFSL